MQKLILLLGVAVGARIDLPYLAVKQRAHTASTSIRSTANSSSLDSLCLVSAPCEHSARMPRAAERGAQRVAAAVAFAKRPVDPEPVVAHLPAKSLAA